MREASTASAGVRACDAADVPSRASSASDQAPLSDAFGLVVLLVVDQSRIWRISMVQPGERVRSGMAGFDDRVLARSAMPSHGTVRAPAEPSHRL